MEVLSRMGSDNKNLEVRKRDKIQLFIRSLMTGLVGGFLLGFSWIVLSYFNFVEFSPRAILLFKWKSLQGVSVWLGSLITILLISIFSIIIAIIYYAMLKKINSIWIGVMFGLTVWFVIFVMIGFTFPHLKLAKLQTETIITTLCIFLLYGTFIGYSISYDYYRIKTDSMLS